MHVFDLLEERDPRGTYTLKEVKGKLDRVTTEIKGNKGAAWEKIAVQYHELDLSIKKLQSQRDDLNAEIKSKAKSLFDVEDETLTRVVETVNMTLTLSKKVHSPSVPKVDGDAVVRALAEADLPKELRKMVNAIIKANTKMTEPKTSPERLTVDKKEVNEAVSLKGIAEFFSKIVSTIKSWFKVFDGKFNAVNRQVKAL